MVCPMLIDCIIFRNRFYLYSPQSLGPKIEAICESLKIIAHICLLCHDLEVVSQQSFVSLLQVFVAGMQSSVST